MTSGPRGTELFFARLKKGVKEGGDDYLALPGLRVGLHFPL